jgi:hypothetical protein
MTQCLGDSVYFDGTGLCVFYKRLDAGTFRTPISHDGASPTIVLSERQLSDLFAGIEIDVHAQTTANLLSIVASAQLHDLEPEEYMRDLLRVLPHWPRDRYLELAPKYWRATRERLDAVQLEAELGPLTIPEAQAR